MSAKLRQFAADERGAVAPIFAICLFALIATGALAWDVSRAFALRAELDAAADAAALAGATQLDGTDGARERATDAAGTALITNGQRLADTAETDATSGATITYLSNLETREEAETDADARYIQVDIAPKQLSPVLGAAINSGVIQARARAVAGYTMALCRSPPIYVCAPPVPANTTFDPDNYIGHTIPIQFDAGSGNWGYIDVGNGANAVKEAMGSNASSTQCISLSPLPQPGNISSADAFLNTRFDIYRGPASSLNTDPDYAPARSTIVGYSTTNVNQHCGASSTGPNPNLVLRNTCSGTNTIYSGGMGFPIDCNQTTASGWGSGQWNVRQYFLNNHNGPGAPANPSTYTPSGGGWSAYGPNGTGGATTPTRYQVYNWEKAMLPTPATAAAIAPAPGFVFSYSQRNTASARDAVFPTCNTTNPEEQTPDRRTITVAIASCPVNGRDPVNIVGFMDLFLVFPVADQRIYAEVIGRSSEQSDPGKSTLAHRIVLYE